MHTHKQGTQWNNKDWFRPLFLCAFMCDVSQPTFINSLCLLILQKRSVLGLISASAFQRKTLGGFQKRREKRRSPPPFPPTLACLQQK